jgi:hypothetical protein
LRAAQRRNNLGLAVRAPASRDCFAAARTAPHLRFGAVCAQPPRNHTNAADSFAVHVPVMSGAY